MSKEVDYKYLDLVLSQKAFDVTGTIEKSFEIRNCTKWLQSRIFDKAGNYREYDFVRIHAGYKKDRDTKIFKFGSFERISNCETYSFSNGLVFDADRIHYKINLVI